jgi:hypothetical protein
MNIDKALKLKPGDAVRFPEDRGNVAGQGRVKNVSEEVQTNHQGHKYIWVCLQGTAGVWPSNRLS